MMEIDDEISFNTRATRAKVRRSLGEITNSLRNESDVDIAKMTTPEKSKQEVRTFAWKDRDSIFPPEMDLDMMVNDSKSLSPLMSKTPPASFKDKGNNNNKENNNHLHLQVNDDNLSQDSDDDYEETVAIDVSKLASSTASALASLAKLNKPKYSEADIESMKKQWKEENTSIANNSMASEKALEEALAISDILLESKKKAERRSADLAEKLEKLEKIEEQVEAQETKLYNTTIEMEQLQEQAKQHEEENRSLRSERENQTINTNNANNANNKNTDESEREREIECEHLRQELAQAKEDGLMHQTQKRALTHSLQALEEKQGQIQQTHTKEMSDMKETMTEEFDSKIKGMAAEVQALEKALLDKEEEMYTKVSEAKQKVYNKVKAQFENGNKEFNKLKAERDKVAQELDASVGALKKEKEKVSDAIIATKKAEDRTDALATDAATLLKGALCSKQQISGIDKTVKSLASLSSSSSSSYGSANSSSAKNDEAVLANFKSLCQQAAAAIDTIRSDLEERTRRADSAESSKVKITTQLENVRFSLDEAESEAKTFSDQIGNLSKELFDLKEEEKEGKIERNSQMMAVAKLATQNAGLEKDLEAAEKDQKKAEERSGGLKKMNEELMEMLEESMRAK